jgi:hypothetical protein
LNQQARFQNFLGELESNEAECGFSRSLRVIGSERCRKHYDKEINLSGLGRAPTDQENFIEQLLQ